MSGILYSLTDADKQLIKLWVAKQREWNTEVWEKTKEGRAGYEKALRHLLYALDDEGLTI